MSHPSGRSLLLVPLLGLLWGFNWPAVRIALTEIAPWTLRASGMTFAGRVQQLITVSLGLDDWEWGVTLWAKNPQYLTSIVYRMRFDEASARYAQFGPFYVSYVTTPAAMLDHCRIGVRK